VFVFDDGERVLRLDAHIDEVESRRLDQLTDADALREALPDAEALRDALRRQYPGLDEEDLVEVATFHLLAP
jgi:hypothetical protein